jgi:hypothetical protein
VKYCDNVNHLLSMQQHQTKQEKSHTATLYFVTLTTLVLFLFQIPYVLFNGVFFQNSNSSLLEQFLDICNLYGKYSCDYEDCSACYTPCYKCCTQVS